MSRPQHEGVHDVFVNPYNHMSYPPETGHSSHRYFHPHAPPRDSVPYPPSGAGQRHGYHYPPSHPNYLPYDATGGYHEPMAYTTVPPAVSPGTSSYRHHSFHMLEPDYQQTADYEQSPPGPYPLGQSRPPEPRLGGHHDDNGSYHGASFRPRHEQPSTRRSDAYRQGAADRSTACAMTQRQTTFHATPPAITFGPNNSVPNRVAPVLNLIGPNKASVVAGIRFRLSIRQQPEAARACGSGERDRRNIDPPPVVQLHVEGPNLTKEDIKKYLRWDGYVVSCWIYWPDSELEASKMPDEYHHQRRLTGSQVSGPFFGTDENGVEGCFFTFSDLSVRSLGKFRLKFNMIMLDVTKPGKSKHFPNLAEVMSEPFSVHTAKDFPGISESSGLVRALRAQGCIISIKKGNEKRKQRLNEADDFNDDDDSED